MVDVAYVPKMCNHCDDAPCIKAAGDGSVYKRPDGIVIIDPVKAKGRKDLAVACPYGAIFWNEAAELPQMWIFDAHLLDNGWTKPRCVQVCPTGALEAVHGSDAALRERTAQQELEVLRPELDTKPRVLYRNLRRATRCLLGGNVSRARDDGRTENVEGAHVELSIEGHDGIRETLTDHFGDFRIDALQATGASYALRIRHDKFGETQLTGALHESVILGSILLGRTAGLYSPAA